MADTIFQTLTDPRYYPRPDSPEDRDEDSCFDPDVDPTEFECNTCGWRGQTPARTSYPRGTIERRYCPTCRKWTETPEEWNLVPADPFEELGAGDEQSEQGAAEPARKPVIAAGDPGFGAAAQRWLFADLA